MSKPIIRVALAVLISLGIIAASTPSVQARLGSILQKADSNYTSAGNKALGEASMGGRARYYFQSDPFFKDSYHECGSEDPTVDY